MLRVLITGGSGLIGQTLRIKLEEKGYEVILLSRNKKIQDTASIAWDIDRNEIDREALNSCDYIIHLAGANIGAKRWTRKRKQEILDSRIKSAELIFHNIDLQNKKLKAFVSASAIGYYGAITSEHIYNEVDPPAGDFLGQTCEKWELAADRFAEIDIRTVKIRTGIVLSKKGGALSKLQIPVRLGLGAPTGPGNQYMPWIHMDDLCSIYIHALESEDIDGAYNAVAPEQITNKEFTRNVAKALKKPFWTPNIPAFAMKLLFGEMAAMLLTGSRVASDKIRKTGFTFKFPDIDSALEDLYFEDSP
ncbi:MAG: TIGR01777 family oxidoreductase [Bacteroidota bacterium]|nr:TIGR01777 family oxidoreductase [Bacteroidota bacterium]